MMNIDLTRGFQFPPPRLAMENVPFIKRQAFQVCSIRSQEQSEGEAGRAGAVFFRQQHRSGAAGRGMFHQTLGRRLLTECMQGFGQGICGKFTSRGRAKNGA